MHVNDDIKDSIKLSGNSTVVSENTFKQLLENCYSVLLKGPEVHNTSSLLNSKPDVIKAVYAAFLTISAEFARNNSTKSDVIQFLKSDCKLPLNRANIFASYYDTNKLKLQAILCNIGTFLPHIVDTQWKVDYIVKSSNLDEAEGPLFRIALSTEEYDPREDKKKLRTIAFTCNSEELQDLVYKLKDAVRHCQKLSTEH